MTLYPGRIYQFIGIGAGPGLPIPARGDVPEHWKYAPSRYRLISVSRCYRTGQRKVNFVGINNDHDHGIHHQAGLRDWIEQFRLEEEPAAEPVPEKVAGTKTEGSGA